MFWGIILGDKVVGLDIGTCFIRVAIGELDADNNIEIIGLAKRPSQGLRNGVIVNIDAAMNAIRETVEEADRAAGVEVTSVCTAIGGSQVESTNSTGQTGVDASGRNLRPMEIGESAKKRVIDVAKSIMIPLDKKLIHVIPQDYIIDGQAGYKNPIGIMGVRLEVSVHLVMASETAFANIQQCITRAGYNLDNVMLKTLAAAKSTLHSDEMDLGSILIDLGGGTTDVIVINNGAPVFTASIPVGGNLVTNDIAIVKGIPNAVAEKIKVESGSCWVFGSEENEEVIIPGVGGRPPEQTNRLELCQIIAPRMEEILTLVKKEVVRRSNLTKLSGSIVLTGGGALMPGVVELAQSVWKTSSVRIGCCSDMGGVDKSYREPDFATVMGLVQFNNNSQDKKKSYYKKAGKSASDNGRHHFIKDFIKHFF